LPGALMVSMKRDGTHRDHHPRCSAGGAAGIGSARRLGTLGPGRSARSRCLGRNAGCCANNRAGPACRAARDHGSRRCARGRCGWRVRPASSAISRSIRVTRKTSRALGHHSGTRKGPSVHRDQSQQRKSAGALGTRLRHRISNDRLRLRSADAFCGQPRPRSWEFPVGQRPRLLSKRRRRRRGWPSFPRLQGRTHR
jgi:hypothetical protein